MIYYLPRAILFLLLFFIPVVQIGASVVWFLFNAWALALQYLTYPMENHQLNFKMTRKKSNNEKLLMLSFGSLVTLFSMIPILNLFIMPVAVASATLLWLDNFHNKND